MLIKFLKKINKKLGADNPNRYGAPIPCISDNFNIWTSKGNCPICETEMMCEVKKIHSDQTGPYIKKKTFCKNNCYETSCNCLCENPCNDICENKSFYIFGRYFHVYPPMENVMNNYIEKQKRSEYELYEAINYWKEGERYLIEMLLEGKFEWKK